MTRCDKQIEPWRYFLIFADEVLVGVGGVSTVAAELKGMYAYILIRKTTADIAIIIFNISGVAFFEPQLGHFLALLLTWCPQC